ncbi:MAG TPA: hypothetical protein V6C76_11885 [Drouetiella sp.]
MATIPRLKGDAASQEHLPGINPKDFLVDKVKKPKNFAQAIVFLRDKKICKVTQKWNEDEDILIMSLKTSDDKHDNSLTQTISVDPYDLEESADEIVKCAQWLWTQRHISVMGIDITTLVTEESDVSK